MSFMPSPLYQRAGEELLTASVENERLRSQVMNILSDRMVPAKVGTSGAGSACRTRSRNTASNYAGRYFLPDGRVSAKIFLGN